MRRSSGLEDVVMPEPDEVPRRLRELSPDLTLDLFRDVLIRGQGASNFCTASHPNSCAGTMAYLETNGGLRETLGGGGWTLNDEDNIPRIISPDRSITITAVSGDRNTGIADRSASTRRPRGAASLRIVRRNAQLVLLLDDQEVGPDEEPFVSDQPMWYLLYFRDEDVVRSELSLARSVKSNGKIEWIERLLLPDINMLEGPPSEGEGNQGPDVDVPVYRRTG